jgi:hypothetical protein
MVSSCSYFGLVDTLTRIERLHKIRHGTGTKEHIRGETVVFDDHVCSFLDIGLLKSTALKIDDVTRIDHHIETVPLLGRSVERLRGVTREEACLNLLKIRFSARAPASS